MCTRWADSLGPVDPLWSMRVLQGPRGPLLTGVRVIHTGSWLLLVGLLRHTPQFPQFLHQERGMNDPPIYSELL